MFRLNVINSTSNAKKQNAFLDNSLRAKTLLLDLVFCIHIARPITRLSFTVSFSRHCLIILYINTTFSMCVNIYWRPCVLIP